MQNSYPVDLHKSQKVFSKFVSDMEILPSYTPVFLIDGKGRVAESRKLNMPKDGFGNIISVVCEKDKVFYVDAQKEYDAFTVEASFGDGKEHIVVSKDEHGFSRCVVCSLSDSNCVHLHEYYEKLSCYKDYLDSFTSLIFSCASRVPVLRLFRMRAGGVAELMKLSRTDGNERILSFPFDIAADKLCKTAEAMHEAGNTSISILNSGKDASIEAPESFFKLMLCLIAYGFRCSRDGKLEISAKECADNSTVLVQLSVTSASCGSDMYLKALGDAFSRAGMPFESHRQDGGMIFSCVTNRALKKEQILSDSLVIASRIDSLLGIEVVSDLYCTLADI